jgi:hypothetical protein
MDGKNDSVSNHFDYFCGGQVSDDPTYWQGGRIIEMPADNHCGFHAILLGLYLLDDAKKAEVKSKKGFENLNLKFDQNLKEKIENGKECQIGHC